MSDMMKYILTATASALAVVVSTAVWAGGIVQVTVPEPGLFGIVAAGVAGVLLAARISRKSK